MTITKKKAATSIEKKNKSKKKGVAITIPSRTEHYPSSSHSGTTEITNPAIDPSSSASIAGPQMTSTPTAPIPVVIELADSPTEDAFVLETVDPCYIKQKTLDRISRSRDERIMVVLREMIDPFHEKFSVLGSGLNVYDVNIAKKMSCNCFDHRMRRTMCKHIIMVLLKVFNLPSNSIIFLEKKITNQQIKAIFETRIPDVDMVDRFI
ncbi:hypothetical protein CLU79DRAFT_724213 [Phycomyces nitens]|nr:hypothetical protein CLU79DRAFT_724213 [Phycomyces nitens]